MLKKQTVKKQPEKTVRELLRRRKRRAQSQSKSSIKMMMMTMMTTMMMTMIDDYNWYLFRSCLRIHCADSTIIVNLVMQQVQAAKVELLPRLNNYNDCKIRFS